MTAVAADGSTVRTGHGGYVMAWEVGTTTYYLIARITQWSLSVTRTEATWGDSDSNGYTHRVGGRRDGTGSITGRLDKTNPSYNDVLFAVDETDPTNNDMVTLVLWEDANEANASRSYYWYIPRALVTSYDLSFDNDSKEPVEWTANFGCDGQFFKPGETRTGTYATPATTALSDRLDQLNPYRGLS